MLSTWMTILHQRKWQKCNLVSGHGLCDHQHGLVMNWVDQSSTSADEQDVVWMSHCHDCVWAVAGFGCFFINLLSRFLREQSPWSFSGLDSCVLAYCNSFCTTSFPPIFLQLRKGPLWSYAKLLQSYVLCSSDQCRTVKLRLPTVRCSGVCWEEGMGGGGVLVFQEVGTMKSLHWRCEMWFNFIKWKRHAKIHCVCNCSSRVRCLTVIPGVLAYIHVYILYVCVYICVCVYVCGHVYMYIYACVYVFVVLCVYTHVYVYVYAYLCIGCLSQYQYFSVWTVLCMRVCVHVHMYAHAYVCRYIYMWIFLQWVLHALYRCFGH